MPPMLQLQDGHVCYMLVLTHILSLNIFSSITCVYQKTSVKIMWFWWIVLCPLELLPWWLFECSWWVCLIVYKSTLPAKNCKSLMLPIFMALFSFSGPWRSGGQDPAGVFANGRNGSPFSGLRVPTGQNHHHSCWQEGQWSLPHHTWHRWVIGEKETRVCKTFWLGDMRFIALYFLFFSTWRAWSILDINYDFLIWTDVATCSLSL